MASERRLKDWIGAFVRYSSTYNTTPLFARWTAVWAVGTVVLRQVGMKSRGNNLHPNMFIELVGGPGTGKSQGVNAIRPLLLQATDMSLIPASITRAGLEDYMLGNLKTRKDPSGSLLLSNECIGLSEEMQGILPDQDLGHLTLYNILYDLPNKHIARTRSHGEVALESPYCSILTGAQPAFLATTMPEQAWGMGFMSRSIMVFDRPRERRSMFEHRDVDHKLKADLIHDLRSLHSLTGWMEWSKEAVALYDEWWVQEGGQPIPTAKRLSMGYNSRREIHFAKLAMVMSLSRSNDLIVTLEDTANAIELLLQTEERMKGIFAEMASTGSTIAIEDALDIVRAKSAAGELCPEATLIETLMQRIAPTQVHAVIENLVTAGAIVSKGGVAARGFRQFAIGNKGGSLL